MLKRLRKVQAFELMKMILFFGLFIYGILITIAFIRINPKPMVFWATDGGTFLIVENNPELRKKERINFVRKFLLYSYNYDETIFDDRMSTVGDMLRADIWEKKKPEWEAISKKTKDEAIKESGRIIGLRQIDESHYEADIEVIVNRRIKRDELMIRANVEIAEHNRSENNPYPFEVISYVEQIN